MKKAKKFGDCKICGKKKELTFEHLPPKSSYNSLPVKVIDGLYLQGETKKYKISQRGVGDYYLCSSCNNYTGANYVSDFNKVVKSIGDYILINKINAQGEIFVEFNNTNPIYFVKQIISILCCIDLDVERNIKLGFNKYLLNKESIELNTSKFDIELYWLSPSSVPMYTAPLVIFMTENNKHVSKMFSEFSFFPLGIIFNLTPEYKIGHGVSIKNIFNFKNGDQVFSLKLPFRKSPYIDIAKLNNIDL